MYPNNCDRNIIICKIFGNFTIINIIFVKFESQFENIYYT